jgi:streptogramin lyase
MEDIEIASGESSIWFTAPGVNKVAEFVLTTETFGEDYPTTNIFGNTVYTPNQIVKDGSGNLGVSSDEGTIGRLLPATLQNFTWFIVASDTSEIGGLYWQQNGSQNEFWFSTSNTGFAGKLTLVSGIVVDIMRFAPGGTNGGIYGITAEADGTAWIASSNTNAIIEWKPPYFTNTYLPTILNP